MVQDEEADHEQITARREPRRRRYRARDHHGRRRRFQVDNYCGHRRERRRHPGRREGSAAQCGALAVLHRPGHSPGGARGGRRRRGGVRLRRAGREADAAAQGPERVDLLGVHDGVHVLQLRVHADEREHDGVQPGRAAAAAARAAGAGGQHAVPAAAGRVRVGGGRGHAAGGDGGDRQEGQGGDGILPPATRAAVLDARRDGGRAHRRAGGAGVRDGVGRRAAGDERGGEAVQRAVPRRELSAHRRVHPRPLHAGDGHPRALRPHDVSVSLTAPRSPTSLSLSVGFSAPCASQFTLWIWDRGSGTLSLPMPTRMDRGCVWFTEPTTCLVG